MDIQGKNIVLTGASGGIGRAIATKLSNAGGRLILVGRDAEKLSQLLTEIGRHDHVSVAADINSDDGRCLILDTCRKTGKPGVSLLINCAGVSEFGLLGELPQSSIRQLIDINLISPIQLCSDLLPLLQRQKEACIINIGSTFGSIGYPGFSTYCASKFGLRGFTEALRRELADTNIKVVYVAPRATRTKLNNAAVVAMNDALGTSMDDPAIVADMVLRAARGKTGPDKYMGWPEKLFVRINALLPGIVDNSLRKQLPIIRRFANSKI
jgi:short-subunit dehydrogenase